MEIYNAKMERMDAPDLTKGYLVKSTRKVHHAAIPGVQEVWHYETIAEYENGGRDVRRVIDVEGRQESAAWDEEIAIAIYHPYTDEELEAMRQEAMRPTMDKRMERVEQELAALGSMLEKALTLLGHAQEKKGGE